MEMSLSNISQAILYSLALVYCFLGLSAITARFFRGMENIVQQTHEVSYQDPDTGLLVTKRQRVWNFAVADITLLAFGTSFPQISLATIDAILNLGNLYAGGESIKKVVDLGVWAVDLAWSLWAYVWLYIILLVWTPEVITIWEAGLTVLQFFILILHAYAQDQSWPFISISILYQRKRESWIPSEDSITTSVLKVSLEDSSEKDADTEEVMNTCDEFLLKDGDGYVGAEDKQLWNYTKSLWKQQFYDALTLNRCSGSDGKWSAGFRKFYELLVFPWKLLFAFVPPPSLCHGWVAFLSSLVFITGISYIVTQLTGLVGDVTGISSFVIALTVLATGASWPDLAASAIAAYRQPTADSAIANITCSNSVNIFIGIGVPWVINTVYNRIVLHDVLRVPASDLSFILVVYFITFVFCVVVLVARRYFIGGELGGPRKWAWASSIFILLLWMVFLVLSCLRVYKLV
eukprot:c23918_g1_i1 orf=228-1613(-)